MILEGSELATGKERGKWRMKTRFRVIPRCFGTYEFGSERLRSVEIEEVCAGNDTMSFEDFLECRRFALTVTLFYNDRIFAEIVALVKLLGRQVSEWLLFVHENLSRHPEELGSIYSDFERETAGELWESHSALERHIKEQDGVIERYIRGEAGNNVLLTSQARVYQNHMEVLNRAAFRCTREFLKSAGLAGAVDEHYLQQLELYSLWKKKGLMDLDTDHELEMDYDFVGLEQAGFSEIPSGRTPTKVRFTYLPWQKALLRDQLRRFGTSLPGWGKILSRIPIKKMHRRAVYASENVTAVA